MRAADLARIIRNFGKDTVGPTNVARFFREQKQKNKYIDFWKEDKKGYFTISQQGRDVLDSIIQSNRKLS